MKKRSLALGMALLLCLLFSACGEDRQEQPEGSYAIYYTNIESTKVTAVYYQPKDSDAEGEELADELLRQLAAPPNVSDCKVAKPESVTLEKAELSDGNLILHFSENYREMDRITEVLCRMAYVRTLTQIPQVETVEFQLGEEPLTDAGGHRIGPMTAEDFIDNTDKEMDDVTLYFANQAGDKLIPVTEDAVMGSGISKERVVLEKLLEGPQSGNVIGTIPEGTKLLSVSTDQGVCYVNLSEEFLTPLPDVKETISLYSIVNSLCQLPGVDQVQIAINGETDRTLIDEITFAVPFEENRDLIEVNEK